MITKTVDVDFELDEEAIESVAKEFDFNESGLVESLEKALTLSKTVEVEINLQDFTIDELIEEVESRADFDIPDYRIDCIDKLRSSILKMKGTPPVEGIEIETLEDKIKIEHFARVFGKYSSSQIEKLLPE